MDIITTEHLTKSYGKKRGIIDLNLAVKEGEFYGFIGPNGAGKSTTIRTLLGLMRPTSGSVSIMNIDVYVNKRKVLANIGYIPSEAMFYSGVTVSEILNLSARLRRQDCREESRRLCERLQLDPGQKADELSLGNRKKIALVCALFHSPRLLLLDEASTGLDSLIKKRFKDYLLDCNQKGTTIFYCSHDMTEIQELCERTAIIRGGSILEVSEVSALSSSDSRRVSVKTDDDLSALFTLLHIQQTITLGGYVCFAYHGAMDDLIKALACFRVEDIQIGPETAKDRLNALYDSLDRYVGKLQGIKERFYEAHHLPLLEEDYQYIGIVPGGPQENSESAEAEEELPSGGGQENLLPIPEPVPGSSSHTVLYRETSLEDGEDNCQEAADE